MTSERQAGWSLGTRIALWSSSSTFLLVTLATVFLYWSLVRTLSIEDSRMLRDRLQTVQGLLEESPDDMTRLKRRVEKEWATREIERVFVKITDEKGTVITETSGLDPEVETGLFGTESVLASVSSPGAQLIPLRIAIGDRDFRAQRMSFDLPGHPQSKYFVSVALDRSHEEAYLRMYRQRLAAVLAVALVLSALVGRRVAKRGLEPVHEIASSVERIESSNLASRITVADLPLELETLALRFNDMLGRLSESFERLSRFSADLAHELRTPINNLRGEIEVTLGRGRSAEEYKEALASCLEECLRLSRIIDSLLFLARAEHPEKSLVREPISIGTELERLAEFYEASAAEAGVQLGLEGLEGDATLIADRTLFQRAVGNLISNAIKYTPSGGSVTVALRRTNGHMTVIVRDSGEGIAAAHLPHVFDRFYRVDPARSGKSGGMGLGLAIVKSIATIHGGTVDIESEPGRGTTVSLSFPC